MGNPFIEVVDKQRAFQHFHQCRNKLDDIGDELGIVYKEIERLRKENEWLIGNMIRSFKNPAINEAKAKENILKIMQQALKDKS